MKYNDNFAYDLAIGQAEEIWLGNLLKGKKLEIKRDFVAGRTGNIFVEYESYGKPSGIKTTQADYWAFILDNQRVIIVPTKFLKDVARHCKQVIGGDKKASKGVLVPVDKLVR